MSKMWVGRTDGKTSAAADGFNSSIGFDSRMFAEDIGGSAAHADMLARCGIITEEEARKITDGLRSILEDLREGRLDFDPASEDIHMFVEETLTSRIGDAGKKLHTARSRNDQVALDLRLYLRGRIKEIRESVISLASAFVCRAEEQSGTVMPGYTHMQRAQPVTFGQHMAAYASMFVRDIGRLDDCSRRMNLSPIGACALAGTGFPTDREYEAGLLGFDGVAVNSMDAVSDRDFCVELLSALSVIMMHLSRLCEELVLWSSWEFGFIELPAEYTTGSSIMPQKKNPDMAELIRGKTGRVYGDLIGTLTVLKGLPLAYNKDMQEDKESVFDAVDTVLACLGMAVPMISGLKVRSDRMRRAAGEGFINATDLADYLVSKGLPFRTAYRISGSAVAYCIDNSFTLETLPLEKYISFCPLIGEDVYEAVDLDRCVASRNSLGGTSPDQVRAQAARLKELLAGLSSD